MADDEQQRRRSTATACEFIIRRPMTVIHSLTRSVGTCPIDRILRVRPHHKADGRAAGEDETNNHLIKQTSESDRIIKWTAGPSGRAKQTTISQSGPPRTMLSHIYHRRHGSCPFIAGLYRADRLSCWRQAYVRMYTRLIACLAGEKP